MSAMSEMPLFNTLIIKKLRQISCAEHGQNWTNLQCFDGSSMP